MKKISLLLIIVATTLGSFSQGLYEQANTFYANGNYADAIKTYKQILVNKQISADLHYNLANAYYKNNDIADAILHYEKALKFDPSNEDAIHNLKFANAKTVDKIEAVSQLAINSGWKSLVRTKSADSWATWTIALLFLSITLLVIYLFVAQQLFKKASFYFGILFLVITLITFILASSANSYTTNSKSAIIYSASVNTYSEPNKSSTKLFTLHQGTKVNILKKSHNWLRIKLPNGNIGWLQKSKVRGI